MRKSIRQMVMIRVIIALACILLFSVTVTLNIIQIDRNESSNAQTSALLARCQSAETAHYHWASNLSNALYAGSEFTGSIDPTTCVLGQWLYGEAGTEDESILALRSQLEPLHKELHSSATYVLDMKAENITAAQAYYQNTISSNLSTLVGLLDQVIDKCTTMSDESTAAMERSITIMHFTTVIGLAISLISLISLVIYVLRGVVKPILQINEGCKPLQEGNLRLKFNYTVNDELGDLSKNLENSMSLVYSYVQDIDRMMQQLSTGDFNIQTSVTYIGDFRLIEESINSFTSTISDAFSHIHEAEYRVSNHADQLSNGAQALAQGATEQASAVEELYATLDDLSKTAEQNVQTASNALSNAQMTGEQVSLSSRQMEQMVAAMHDITDASQQISKIISTIESIASQTNLLAINAAVEAARAGAAGKGFAVVSTEVRSLAAKSDQASKATKKLIDNAVQAAARGSEIVDEVSETLQKTLELVTKSNSEISEIAEAVKGEAASIAQVTEGIGQISAVVQTNSASSEESAAVSNELFEQVRTLQSQTNRFKLKNQASALSGTY